MRSAGRYWSVACIAGLLVAAIGCSGVHPVNQPVTPLKCDRLIKAEVVALEQAIVLNRYGAFNPSGMLFALKQDVVLSDGTPLNDSTLKDAPGNVKLRDDKRPRPLVLRANEGDCLEVRFHNLLMPAIPDERARGPEQYDGKVPGHMEDPSGVVYPTKDGKTGRELVKATAISNDWPHTRIASFHVNGLEYVPVPREDCPVSTMERQWVCGMDGDNVGLNRGLVNTGGNPAIESIRPQLEQQGTLVKPGQSALYRYRAAREGTYFAYSAGATVGGEGDGGQLGMGLFGAVNVQPKGSKWYRSQVTHRDLMEVTVSQPAETDRHPYRVIDYEKRYTAGPYKNRPILAMLDGNEIVHSDLNAVIVLDNQSSDGSATDGNDTTSPKRRCRDYVDGNSCGKSYREFTVIMHDEVKAVQAFPELEDEGNPLHYVKDGMGINYGVGGMGAMVMARNRKVGPVKDCPECRAEEFFLSSWANGDPALILKWNKADPKRPIGALYPDDPSNVHHSYMGDPVRFRNIHAGPKETHVFHLHAHQWVMDPSDPGSTYLDSQTISPGATFSYEVEFGGSGNKNRSPGDSIFHCHLYPHFAQGMWELWRVHDVFEDGKPSLFNPKIDTRGRNYPDAEVNGGTENPAIVPLPGTALPPMPTEDFRGYPFYVAGEAGHRPPQPPLDMDENGKNQDGTINYIDGGLPRHVLTNGFNTTKPARTQTQTINQDVVEEALHKGGLVARLNAAKVYRQNPNALLALAEQWEFLGALQRLDKEEPTNKTKIRDEENAMKFHEGGLTGPGFKPVTTSPPPHSDPPQNWEQEPKGYITDWATRKGEPEHSDQAVFFVNGRDRVAGAPFADPCPDSAPKRTYMAGVIQTELTVNRHGWFDPQARILALEQDIQDIINPDTRTHLPEPLFFRANSGDCITFKHSNFLPNAMGLDDFQIYTPTDTVGQHIHLVKFDVTSSDGSGNGWNYEDGTFAPEEVRERVIAYNRAQKEAGRPAKEFLTFKTHPLFEQKCGDNNNCKELKTHGTCPDWAMNPTEMEKRVPKLTGANEAEKVRIETQLKELKKELKKINEEHPFCAAQRTVQRWYADPILDPKTGKDYTLRTVFTHDHFGPSTHQQHGLYAALVVEPANSVWLPLDRSTLTAEESKDPKKILGGADLFAPPSTNDPATEVKRPLVLRDDGGPTATRANIIAPKCIGQKDSNPLMPEQARKDCTKEDELTHDTKREFAVAFADFAILYNTALEPINPEERDLSALRFGHRQVAINLPKPLAISSEDPGTQLINYRNEPVPLRITKGRKDGDDIPPKDVVVAPPLNETLGGFDYQQKPCTPGDLLCTGDMANVFSSLAHRDRDSNLLTKNYGAIVSLTTREILKNVQLEPKLDEALEKIERWRKDFNCALYPANERPSACTDENKHIKNQEPWRVMGDPATPILPVYEGDPVQIRLVQGAQEAQHVFTMNGVKWLREPGVKNSGYINAQPLGISEHFEFDIRVSPLSARRTDYLYFGSSMDQLWDGMWGVMRAFGRDGDKNDALMFAPKSDGTPAVGRVDTSVARLDTLKAEVVSLPAIPAAGNVLTQVCANAVSPEWANRKQFDISAVRAHDLLAGPDENTDQLVKARSGLTYNQRLNLHDPNAIVFVALRDNDGGLGGLISNKDNEAVLKDLRQQYRSRSIEPLALRAPAGACIEVKLRNLLPASMSDGPEIRQSNGERMTGHFSDNFMSMIVDGFNYNQIRMSSSIGISAPMVTQFVQHSDGSNVGINGKELGAGYEQGSLTPACLTHQWKDGVGCTRTYVWWAGNYELTSGGERKPHGAIELGAVPLRSFGDVIKQPAHGAIGALVIGPEGSAVCRSQDPREQQADTGTDLSATICDSSGNPLYRDFVMVLQDAVDGKQAGWPIPNLKGAEEPDDYGVKAVNYRTEPIWGRRGGDPSIEFEERNEFDYAHVLSSKGNLSDPSRCQAGIKALPELTERGYNPCDPETPIFVATVGTEIRLRVVHPGGHTRQQAITLHGHHWNPIPWKPCLESEKDCRDSSKMYPHSQSSLEESWITQGSYNGVGPMMAANLLVKAGGQSGIPGDYLFRSQASFVFDGGIWGLMRVVPAQILP